MDIVSGHFCSGWLLFLTRSGHFAVRGTGFRLTDRQRPTVTNLRAG